MRRRDFITLLGGAAAAWPLRWGATGRARAAHRRALAAAADDPNIRPASRRSCKALQQLGWTDGRNVRIDTRWAADPGDIRRHATELAALAPDVIVRHRHLDHGAVAAGDPHRADRVRDGR